MPWSATASNWPILVAGLPALSRAAAAEHRRGDRPGPSPTARPALRGRPATSACPLASSDLADLTTARRLIW